MRFSYYHLLTNRAVPFEYLGTGFYFLAIASLLAISLSGSAYFLRKINTDSADTSTPAPASTLAAAISSYSFEKEVVTKKIETAVNEQLCSSTLAGSCRFEERHIAPFTLTLQPDQVARLSQLHKNTVLVITFNRRSTYYVSPLVHALYSRIFAHVFYCGPSALNSTRFQDGINEFFGADQSISRFFSQNYLGYQTENPHIDGYGENNYYCFNLALQKASQSRPTGPLIEGVFVLADDAIFSFWNAVFLGGESLQLSKSYSLPFPLVVYNTETLRSCDITSNTTATCDQTNPWINWPQNYQQPTSNFYHELIKLANADNTGIYSICLKEITRRSRGIFRVMTGYADMFYVARNRFRHALAMFELASKHKVFQEIAVPTVFGCFGTKSSSFIDDSLDNTNSYDEFRKSPWEAYDARKVVMHPFKLSNIVKAMFGDKEARRSRKLGICLYCQLVQYSKYLSLLLSNS